MNNGLSNLSSGALGVEPDSAADRAAAVLDPLLEGTG